MSRPPGARFGRHVVRTARGSSGDAVSSGTGLARQRDVRTESDGHRHGTPRHLPALLRPVLQEHGAGPLTVYVGNPVAHNLDLLKYVGALVCLSLILPAGCRAAPSRPREAAGRSARARVGSAGTSR